MSERFQTRAGSQSSHSCCFGATVVDMTAPDLMGDGRQFTDRDGKPRFQSICECWDIEEAVLICRALNAYEAAEPRRATALSDLAAADADFLA